MANTSAKLRRNSQKFKYLLELLRAKTTKASGGALNMVAISMVRNEQDIIEPFLRHHSKLFDLLFLLDNRSTDNTRKIILSVARELGNIVLCDIPDQGYNQSEIMTRALHHVQGATFAEYIFLLDADEFVPVVDKADLDQHLAHVPLGGIGLMPWKTFIPDPSLDEDTTPDPLHRLRYQRRNETIQYYKAVFRAHGSIDSSIVVDQGNHSLRDGFGRRLPSFRFDDLPLLHFPLRSVDQLAAKGVLSWLANQARDARSSPGAGYQWKRLHDLVKDGGRPNREELAQEALGYALFDAPPSLEAGAVRADHGISVQRRYSDGSFVPADKLIAEAKSPKAEVDSFRLPAPARGQDRSAEVENAFDGAWHWDFLFLDVPLVRFAIERFAPDSVLDLGCGNGLYPLLYKHLGVSDVLGVDGIDPEATVLSADLYRKVDLQQPFDAGRRFDLVVCLEVAEHLFPASTDTLFDTIARHTGQTILFSMAEPGQPGNGHINCLPIDAVLSLWANRGWHPDLAMTLGLRAISSMSWFRRNLLVLTHTGETEETPAAGVLRQIGETPFSWYGQAPGKRDYAFSEPLPDLRHGYGLRKV